MSKKQSFQQASIYMDTVIMIKVVTSMEKSIVEEKIEQAFHAFSFVEKQCNRFDEQSELSQLSSTFGTPVAVSELLFQAVNFAKEMAVLTEGAFDPTIGLTLEKSGFNKNYKTGQRIMSDMKSYHHKSSYQDVLLDEENRTIMLKQPLILDLGAVAKGLAVDLASKELCQFEGFYIDAGGDIYAGGVNEQNEPWHIGIQDPQENNNILKTIRLSNAAICTSGSYERKSEINENTHHLMNPTTEASANQLVSCSVIAPFAMAADAFSTAAFIMGKDRGCRFIEENDLSGFVVTTSLEEIPTKGWEKYENG